MRCGQDQMLTMRRIDSQVYGDGGYAFIVARNSVSLLLYFLTDIVEVSVTLALLMKELSMLWGTQDEHGYTHISNEHLSWHLLAEE